MITDLPVKHEKLELGELFDWLLNNYRLFSFEAIISFVQQTI